MKHGFIKVGVASPKVTVANPTENIKEILNICKTAQAGHAKVLVFPELALTGATAQDLIATDTLLSSCETALSLFAKETENNDCLYLIGMPVKVRDALYNAAVALFHGEILGVVPKTNLKNVTESADSRLFTAYDPETAPEIILLLGNEVPFGTDILLTCSNLDDLRIAVQIGEDLLMNQSPDAIHAEAGATVICNLCASAEAVGRKAFRNQLCSVKSNLTTSAFLYAGAGQGESTTDLVFGGHLMVYENGILLAEKAPMDFSKNLILTEIDVQKLSAERRKNQKLASFDAYREIFFELPMEDTKLTRTIAKSPFVPTLPDERKNRCETVLNIQANGLCKRMTAAYAKKLVIGISGGLDSTLAMLVAVRAVDMLGFSAKDVIAVTMPCFGTTKRTKDNATVLCEKLGVDFRCIPIGDSVNSHFQDIGHDPAVRNAAYENAQARERTQVLMDLANDCNGLVVGTGDLSELALGWATYNGDHMAMYGVNADVPKTLIRFVVAYCADLYEKAGETELAHALRDILDTPISPELLPSDGDGKIAQKTEDLVGPYEIHDFYIYYFLRYGFAPGKLFQLAKYAFAGEYSDSTLLHWLEVFFRRFFSQQFKRSCLPDGPKVGSVDLSPRGAWAMPSDASSAVWLAEIEKLKANFQ